MRRSFQRLVKLVHPDVCAHPKARDAFNRVTKAHEVLKSPARAAQHTAFVRREAEQATGLYAWLDENAAWISPWHATAVLVAAAALQVAVSLLQAAASSESDRIEAHQYQQQQQQSSAELAATLVAQAAGAGADAGDGRRGALR